MSAPLTGQNMVVTQNQQTLPSMIRNFVYYDNKRNEYNKLVTEARNQQSKYEEAIINTLNNQGLRNANIQTSDGSLSVIEDKVVPPLTLSNLRKYLGAYYKQKGTNMDETDAIMNFIEVQKVGGSRVGLKLKRTVSVPRPPQGL
jgi:hypothetical protein